MLKSRRPIKSSKLSQNFIIKFKTANIQNVDASTTAKSNFNTFNFIVSQS